MLAYNSDSIEAVWSYIVQFRHPDTLHVFALAAGPAGIRLEARDVEVFQWVELKVSYEVGFCISLTNSG